MKILQVTLQMTGMTRPMAVNLRLPQDATDPADNEANAQRAISLLASELYCKVAAREQMKEDPKGKWRVVCWSGRVMYNGRTWDSFAEARSYIALMAYRLFPDNEADQEDYEGELYAEPVKE